MVYSKNATSPLMIKEQTEPSLNAKSNHSQTDDVHPVQNIQPYPIGQKCAMITSHLDLLVPIANLQKEKENNKPLAKPSKIM